MTLIAGLFSELPARKNMIREMSNKSCFRGPFNRQHLKWAETLLQSERQHHYTIFDSL